MKLAWPTAGTIVTVVATDPYSPRRRLPMFIDSHRRGRFAVFGRRSFAHEERLSAEMTVIESGTF